MDVSGDWADLFRLLARLQKSRHRGELHLRTPSHSRPERVLSAGDFSVSARRLVPPDLEHDQFVSLRQGDRLGLWPNAVPADLFRRGGWWELALFIRASSS